MMSVTQNLDLYDLRRREVQAIGAAISTRDWWALEQACNSIRDKLDRAGYSIGSRPPTTTQPTTNDAIPAGDTVAFVQERLMNADYDPSQFDRDFAAAIDARVVAASAGDLATLFCAAPLPDDVCADQCATVQGPGRTGTNLLTVDQATRVFTAALSAAPSAPATPKPSPTPKGGLPGRGECYRHVKRGTVYEVIAEAKVQDASDCGIVEGDVAVIYRGDDGQIWAREYSEFHDGRFAPAEAIRDGAEGGEG